MRKHYNCPEIEVETFEVEDVILSSGNVNTMGEEGTAGVLTTIFPF